MFFLDGERDKKKSITKPITNYTSSMQEHKL